MKLSKLLHKINTKEILGNTEMEIAGIHFDSREIKEAFLFVAIKGIQQDGHRFIEKAIENGASALVIQEGDLIYDIRERFPQLTLILVENSAKVLGLLGDNFYEHPSRILKLVGITGTNGKTTCATLLFQLFSELGYECGLISTVQNCIGKEIIPSKYTTPDALYIHSLLNEMVEKGCDYCFMEVSSHAIVQERISGLNFRGGVFTNITHDHLDFHKTFENYLSAKKAFFDGLSSKAFAITNLDDRNGKVMVQNTNALIKGYALKNIADYKAKVIENHFSGMLLRIQNQEIWFKMIGNFNAYNLLAVFATASELGEDPMAVLTILSKLKGAEGRFEYIPGPGQRSGVVDYAHTPDALENVLKTMVALRKNKENIITVIGCGGDRDKEKRPLMAAIACKLSDKVILTADNPRTEKAEDILADMEFGLDTEGKKKTLVIAERRSAIKTAFHLSLTGDIILIAGKGHEKYQEINGVRYPFDDKIELETAFKTNTENT